MDDISEFTATVAKSRPIPVEKIISIPIGTTRSNTVKFNSIPENTITTISAQKEAITLTTLDATLESVNKYFGIYTFLIKGALLMIDDIALDVDSEKS